ncbi:MAG: CPBP family intramembrane metalloprotease [Acidobacteriia bacterium]|nr:CPBP family intramembrane metalloprotease [Terriglobia bacterium]
MIISHLIPALLLFGFPIWDFWEARQLRESIHPQVKIWSYLRIITGLWIVSLLVIWRIPLRQLYAAPLVKIPFLSHVPHEAVIGLMIPLILGILLPPFLALVHRGIRQRLLIPYEKMDYLLPNSLLEMALFSGVAISAGVCEEIIYRGYLLRYLQASPWGLPLGWGLLASSAVFGLAHLGQGVKGVLETAFIGLVLGGLYIATGSLLFPILVHALIDLRALFMALLRKLPTVAPA